MAKRLKLKLPTLSVTQRSTTGVVTPNDHDAIEFILPTLLMSVSVMEFKPVMKASKQLLGWVLDVDCQVCMRLPRRVQWRHGGRFALFYCEQQLKAVPSLPIKPVLCVVLLKLCIDAYSVALGLSFAIAALKMHTILQTCMFHTGIITDTIRMRIILVSMKFYCFVVSYHSQ